MEIKSLKDKEKEHLLEVLKKTTWDIELSARLLHIETSELRRKMKSHGIVEPGAWRDQVD